MVDDEVEKVELSDERRFSFGREGESIVGDFEEGDSEGPDVRGNGVVVSQDPFGLKSGTKGVESTS